LVVRGYSFGFFFADGAISIAMWTDASAGLPKICILFILGEYWYSFYWEATEAKTEEFVEEATATASAAAGGSGAGVDEDGNSSGSGSSGRWMTGTARQY
jgi:hypothetical protein